MKHVPWILLLISILLFLVAIYNKFVGHDGWLLGYTAQSWWRCSIACALWAIAAKMVCPFTEAEK